jgi:hypothetical protein
MLEGFCFAAFLSFFFTFTFVLLQADKNTRKETTKITKENSTEKTQMETCRVWSREKKKGRILQAYENKISYTLEDGHVGRNMY